MTKYISYLLALFVIINCWSCKDSEKTSTNVILIMTDDQGYGDLACLGNPIVKTPNLDKLYKESLRFTDFHVNSFCAPSRAALMTGRMSDRTHVRSTVYGRNYLNIEETTMAEFFKVSGYRTAHFGKWHLGNNYPYRPIDRGFDRWVGQGGGTSSASDYWGNDRWNDFYNCDGEWDKKSGFGTDVFFNEAMDFIKKSRSNPFFIYLATYVPHGPMNILKEWRDEYTDGQTEPPRNVEWGDTWDLYASITRFDYNLGRLRDFLENNGLEENTLLVFTTDNGSSDGYVVYNAGMRGHKGSSYDGGHRVPMFIHWPGGLLQEGKDIDAFSWHFDLLPTFIDLCGLKTPERGHLPFDGKSLAPLIKGKNDPDRNDQDRVVFMHTQNTRETPVKGLNSLVATEKWRLINGKQLYNIKADPGQENNIASKNENVVAELLQRYNEHWDEIKMAEYPYPRPIIGTDYQEESIFTPEDWIRDSESSHTWNQRHVLAGVKNSGFWPVKISKKGTYRFEVRRWPVELDLPLGDGLPKRTDRDITRLGRPVKMDEGKAISATNVQLKINEKVWNEEINPTDTFVGFDIPLTAGNKNIRAWLYDHEGNRHGAYYIYVKKLN